MNNLITILAQAEGQSQGFNPQSLIMIGLMFVIFYVLLIRPQRKRQKELEAKIKSLKTGMQVVTVGGMHGIATNVKERTVTVKIADNVKVEFEKSAIANVIPKGTDKEKDATVVDEQPKK